MVAEYATCTRHHKISTKITNEMRVSQIELITLMSGYIKWLLIDKNAFYKYEKTYIRVHVREMSGHLIFFKVRKLSGNSVMCQEILCFSLMTLESLVPDIFFLLNS